MSNLAKFTLILAFKSIQITYSLKPLHGSQINLQHVEPAGLQNDKIQAGRESKMAADTKIS